MALYPQGNDKGMNGICEQEDSVDSDISLSDMRIPYNSPKVLFTEDNLISKDPISQFHSWFQEACQTSAIQEPNAMCLSTATQNGKPSGRILLLKGYSRDGFRFFTNYNSRKGQELEANPQAAATFYWESLRRSIRIEGHVEKLPEEESTSYFHKRPRSSQISAVVSYQSQPITGRDVLETRTTEMAQKYSDTSVEIPKPDYWGGFILVPDSIEFWQGQTTRLHDRIKFRRPDTGEVPDGETLHEGEEGWVYERLCP